MRICMGVWHYPDKSREKIEIYSFFPWEILKVLRFYYKSAASQA
jgi:hypothetical protein